MSEEQEREPEEVIAEARLYETLTREGELDQLRALLELEPFRDFVWRVLGRCGVYHTSYERNFGDMALKEGLRTLGLWLMAELCEANPEAEIAMKRKANQIAHQEARKEREKAIRRARRAAATP